MAAVSSTTSRIAQDFPCPCGRWYWRKVHAASAPGITVSDEFCRRCRTRYLLVFRVGSASAGFVAAVPFRTEDAPSIRRALAAVPELSPTDIDALLNVAVVAANA